MGSSLGLRTYDLLAGVQYSCAFNKHGFSVPLKRRLKRCRRIMRSIVRSQGKGSPPDGVVTLSPERRALQARADDIAAVIDAYCTMCHHHRAGACVGISRAAEHDMPGFEIAGSMLE